MRVVRNLWLRVPKVCEEAVCPARVEWFARRAEERSSAVTTSHSHHNEKEETRDKGGHAAPQ